MANFFIYGACIVIGFSVTGSFSQSLTSQNRLACGGGVLLRSERGNIYSPNYPLSYYNNLLCSWRIYAPANKIIDVSFNSFALEDSVRCSFDCVIIQDGPVIYTGLRACGKRRPRNFLSFSNNVRIIFKSDRSNNDRGFFIQWAFKSRSVTPDYSTEACGINGIVLTNARGNIHSPNYPGNYPNYQFCNWTIKAPSDKMIEINFQDFALEDDSACRYDYLNVTDGKEQYTGSTFCGLRFPRGFASYSSTVTFTFRSGSRINARGFLIGWEFKDRCADNQFTCWDGTCVPLSWNCNGFKECSDNSDEIECAHESNDLSECGKQGVAPKFTSSPRIIGGNKAISGSWPWQALLVDSGNSSFCGGSVIHPRLILTAAHCTYNLESYLDVGVLVGRYKFTGNVGEQFFKVARIIQHPDYNNTTLKHDIALLQLESDITYTKEIRPICYSESTSINPGSSETCIATGFGDVSTASGHANPDALYQVRLPIVRYELCKQAYHSYVGTNQICTGAIGQGGLDTCQGDSGGPLVCLIGEDTWYQMGVTSFGVGCGRPDYPGVYTNVTAYALWIERETLTVDACTTGTVLTANSGSFASPNYPGNYLKGSNCRWNIIASRGETIKLQFSDFQLTSQCDGWNGDFLQIVDGENQSNHTCGTSILNDFESTTNNVTILFISDSAGSERGFFVNWMIKATTTSRQLTTTSRQPTTTSRLQTTTSVASSLAFCRCLSVLSFIALAVQFGL